MPLLDTFYSVLHYLLELSVLTDLGKISENTISKNWTVIEVSIGVNNPFFNKSSSVYLRQDDNIEGHMKTDKDRLVSSI